MAKERRRQGDPRAAIMAYRAALEHGAPAGEIELQRDGYANRRVNITFLCASFRRGKT